MKGRTQWMSNIAQIKYIFWKGSEPKKEGQLHMSHQPFVDAPLIIPQQPLDVHCVLCPRKKELVGEVHTEEHYHCVHCGHSLVINDIILLMCKCSEVHSTGSDSSIHNSHWYCLECWHPFRLYHQLKHHFRTQHYYPKNKLTNL